MTPIISTTNLSSVLRKTQSVLLFLTSSILTSIIIRTVRSVPIDNGIGDQPEILCLQDSMRILINTWKPFDGHMYVKGMFHSNPSCHLDLTRSLNYENKGVFNIPYRSCRVNRERSLRPAGLSYSTVVIVQFHHLFITKVDRAYRLTCFYMEVDKVVTQGIHVSMIPTTQVSDTRPMPTCKYEVLAGALNGPPVRFAKVGDKVFHKWTCESGVHGMLVHSCIARDGAGSVYELIDKKGCAVDPIALGDLTYTGDLIMAHAQVHVFKFADQMVVNFQCQISLCVKTDGGCNELTPPPCALGPPAGSTYPLAPLQPISPADVDESYPANPPPAPPPPADNHNFGIPAPAQIPSTFNNNNVGSGTYPNPFPPPVPSPKESLGRGPIRMFPPDSITSSKFLDPSPDNNDINSPSFALSNPSQADPNASFDPVVNSRQQTLSSDPLLRPSPLNPISSSDRDNNNVGQPLVGVVTQRNSAEFRGEVGVDRPGFEDNLQQQQASKINQGFTSHSQQQLPPPPPPPPPGLPEEPHPIVGDGVKERFGEVGDFAATGELQADPQQQSESQLPNGSFRNRQGPPPPVLNLQQEQQRRLQQEASEQQLIAPELRGRRDFPQPVPPEQFAFDAADFSSSQLLLNSGAGERSGAVGTSAALRSTNRRRNRQRDSNQQKGGYQALPSGVGLAPAPPLKSRFQTSASRTHRRQPTANSNYHHHQFTDPFSHHEGDEEIAAAAAYDPALFGAVPIHQTFRPPVVAKIKKKREAILPSELESSTSNQVVDGTLDVTSDDMIVFNLDDSFPAAFNTRNDNNKTKQPRFFTTHFLPIPPGENEADVCMSRVALVQVISGLVLFFGSMTTVLVFWQRRYYLNKLNDYKPHSSSFD